MSSLTTVEKRILEDEFDMRSGYVLDFNNITFADLFKNVCGINIEDPKYAIYGISKAKRLRAFWEIENDLVVGKALNEILQLYQHIKPNNFSKIEQLKEIVFRLFPRSQNYDSVETFLKFQFEKIPLESIDIEPTVISLLKFRWEEARKCSEAGAHLAVIFMCGSILEGLLLGIAQKRPKEFNQSNASPKNNGKVKQFHEWKLGEFIDVAHEIGLFSLDIKNFGHNLRDFRNYIHPYHQMASRFTPDSHTAAICLQVLNAAIASLRDPSGRNGGAK